MKKISLSYYDGNDGKGCEYDVYENSFEPLDYDDKVSLTVKKNYSFFY